jgi:hypothetical protein
MQFARPGILVVANKESVLMDVVELIESYRFALRASKPRDRKGVDPNEVVTVYYRLHTNVAEGLLSLVPVIVQPDSWKSDARPDAPGWILLTASSPEVFTQQGQLSQNVSGVSDSPDAQELVVSRSVLIVRQTRKAHDEIAKVIQRVESGDASKLGGGRVGGGGGGFGGGFFRAKVSQKPTIENRHAESFP